MTFIVSICGSKKSSALLLLLLLLLLSSSIMVVTFELKPNWNIAVIVIKNNQIVDSVVMMD